MPDTFVIDGYNLIHALGMIQKQLAPGGLQASRRRLLDLLAQGFADAAERVTVVFDAKQAPPRARQQRFRGLHVHFAPKGQSADDWIEALIAANQDPAKLVVVSNDARLVDAARRRKAEAWSDQTLLDYLEKLPKPSDSAAPPADDRTRLQSAEEKEQWLKEFSDLEQDPDLKEFFDYNRFDEE